MQSKSLQSGYFAAICILQCVMAVSMPLPHSAAENEMPVTGVERQVTSGQGGRILTNTSVWSPDSQWIMYDVRSDPAGDIFDSPRIEAVHADTGEVRVLYRAINGANCGVVTHHPRLPLVVFILGPEHPTADWQYGPNRRQGVVVDTTNPDISIRLDARDLTSPLTPGALRGGTHVHVWDAAGDWLAFTYNDALVEPGLRDIGVAIPGHRVEVKPDHPRNHDGTWFSALVTRTVPAPTPDSDEIKRANEEGWIGTEGYIRSDGSIQRRAIAFQGQVVSAEHGDMAEVFVVDLPGEFPAQIMNQAGLSSTGRVEPLPGVRQRRLTHTTDRRYPGIQGTRHWLRSSPDGSQIACLMKDDSGISQIFTVSPATGETKQLTHNDSDISSAFTWSPDGRWIAHGMAGNICLTDTQTGTTRPVSQSDAFGEIRKEACVFSPDGSRIAFVRSSGSPHESTNQICIIELKE